MDISPEEEEMLLAPAPLTTSPTEKTERPWKPSEQASLGLKRLQEKYRDFIRQAEAEEDYLRGISEAPPTASAQNIPTPAEASEPTSTRTIRASVPPTKKMTVSRPMHKAYDQPASIWAGPCPWQGITPPSKFYRANMHPLAALRAKQHYLAAHNYVTVGDQLDIKKALLGIWAPGPDINLQAIKTALEAEMNSTVKGVFEHMWENKRDIVFRQLFTRSFKVAKEEIRLAIKLRYKGAIAEVEEALKARDTSPVTLNRITQLLWWPANFREE